MNYLIDTDIIIYSLKGNKTVNTHIKNNRAHPKSLSVITYGELIYGARKSQNSEKNLARVRRISEIFPIIDVSPSIMDAFGELKVTLQSSGTTLDDMNLLIASTALAHNLILVTNNVKHFSRINGLEIENWTK
ncbi:MAG: type II toxin-antitoxin system VapC family toxin [Spirochaetia bacterium]